MHFRRQVFVFTSKLGRNRVLSLSLSLLIMLVTELTLCLVFYILGNLGFDQLELMSNRPTVDMKKSLSSTDGLLMGRYVLNALFLVSLLFNVVKNSR